MNYITVLDFQSGRVYQYTLNGEVIEYEEYLRDKGHSLSNCEYMIHNIKEIIKE